MLGVNLSGSEYGPALNARYGYDYIYPSKQEIDYYADKGMTVIRVPIQWERMQPTLNGTLDPNELTRLRDLVAYANAKGMTVVLDARGALSRPRTCLIGQLGNPLYLKTNALFYEFEEIGLNAQRGYASPADLVERYPDFYWKSVSPYLGEAIAHLNVTALGRRWIAGLHSHVFCAEHELSLMGPQR